MQNQEFTHRRADEYGEQNGDVHDYHDLVRPRHSFIGTEQNTDISRS